VSIFVKGLELIGDERYSVSEPQKKVDKVLDRIKKKS
jgi:hypothetical protein